MSNTQLFGTLGTTLAAMVVIFLGAVYFISNQIGQRIADLGVRVTSLDERLQGLESRWADMNETLSRLSERVAKMETG